MGFQSDFSGGELTPSLYASFTAPLFKTGLKRCRNFMITMTRGLINRPGTKYIADAKFVDQKIRLVPFEFSADQTMVLEFGDKYIRFVDDGQYVVNRFNVTNLATTSPIVVTAPGHDFVNDQLVFLQGDVQGVTGTEAIINGDFPTDITNWNTFTNTDGDTTVGNWDPAGNMFVDQTGYYQEFVVQKGEGFTFQVSAISGANAQELPSGSMHIVMVPDDGFTAPYWVKQDVVAENGVWEHLSFDYTTEYSGSLQVVLSLHNGIDWGDPNKTEANFDNASAYAVLYSQPLPGFAAGKWVMVKNVIGDTFEIWEQDGVTPIDGTAYDTLTGSAAVTSGEDLYEIESPYLEEHLFDLQFQQIADVVTIVHPEHSPQELTRNGYATYRIAPIGWNSDNPDAPTSLTVTPVGGTAGGTQYEYVVTSVDKDGSESLGSNIVTAGSFTDWTGDKYNQLSWNVVADAEYYIVYLSRYGVYGRIGTSIDGNFEDNNILPDTVFGGPPLPADIFPKNHNHHPSAVAVHNQRMMYANSNAFPYRVWGTRPGDYHNLYTNDPLVADSTIDWFLASNRIDEIKHLLSWRNQLLLFTAGGLWVANGGDNGFTALEYKLAPNLGIGCSLLPPLQIGESVLFAGLHKEVVYDMTYSFDAEGYSEVDRSIHADHLFKNRKIVQWAYQRRPYSIVWAVTDDGDLLGLTYLPSKSEGAGVWAWHRHDTAGDVESVCVVKEGSEDAVYLSISRALTDGNHRYIERMYSRENPDIYNDAVFLDSAMTFLFSQAATTVYTDGPNGPSAQAVDEETIITGLDHLNWFMVGIVIDGEVFPQQLVENGTITIPATGYTIHVGLPYVSEAETLGEMGKASSGGIQSLQGSSKRPYDVSFYVDESRGFKAGPDVDNLYSTQRLVYGAEMYTGEVKMKIAGSWESNAGIFVQHDAPLPLTILSIASSIDSGS